MIVVPVEVPLCAAWPSGDTTQLATLQGCRVAHLYRERRPQIAIGHARWIASSASPRVTRLNGTATLNSARMKHSAARRASMPSSLPHPEGRPRARGGTSEPTREASNVNGRLANVSRATNTETAGPRPAYRFTAGLTFDPRPPRMSPVPPPQALTTHERTNTAPASPGSRRRSGFEPRPPRVLQPARGACGAGTAGSTRTVTSDVDPNGNRYMWGTR